MSSGTSAWRDRMGEAHGSWTDPCSFRLVEALRKPVLIEEETVSCPPRPTKPSTIPSKIPLATLPPGTEGHSGRRARRAAKAGYEAESRAGQQTASGKPVLQNIENIGREGDAGLPGHRAACIQSRDRRN